MAIKVLLSGFENTGKSTLGSQIKNALVINCDLKEYSFKQTHANYDEWKGLKDFSDFVNSKIVAYKTANKKLPEFVVIDTITQLYIKMTKFNKQNFTGFNIFNQNESDTIGLNAYLEKVLIQKGMNVVIIAHAQIDENDNYTIPSYGAFKKGGSWLAMVNEALYVHKTTNEHKVYFRHSWYPCRSTLPLTEEEAEINKFDINKYLNERTDLKFDIEKFKL